MARRVKDAKLESRAAREKLKARAEPYYRTVDQGVHVGYRKGARTGVWVVRHRTEDKRYSVETVAKAETTLSTLTAQAFSRGGRRSIGHVLSLPERRLQSVLAPPSHTRSAMLSRTI